MWKERSRAGYSSSDSSDQGEFNFETGEISADVEEMDEFGDMGIEPIEAMFGAKRTVKPRPKVDPAQVEAARKLAESRKSPAGKKGKLSTAAHGGVGQPVSVSVSKAMMRRRMSPRRTPIQADTIEETEEPIEEEEEEEESEVETEASSEMSEQPVHMQHDKSFSPLSVHSKDDLDEEHLAVIESGSTTETVLRRTVHTKETVTVVEQRVGQDGEVETVSTTVVKSGEQPSNGQTRGGQYLEVGEGELDTSSEIEKYDENFEPVGNKHALDPSPLSDQSREEQNSDMSKTVVSQTIVREHRGRSFGSDSVSSTVSEPSSVASVIEVKPPANVPEITTQNMLDDEDDEVAQISLAAEKRKVKKKKKKSTSSAADDGLEVDTKVVKKKKKKKVADANADSQTGATGLTVEEGETAATEKPKKKKKKEKDGTEVKKKKKKKTSENSAVVTETAENGFTNAQVQNSEQTVQSDVMTYDQEPHSRPGVYSDRKVTVPLSINTQQATQQEYQHSSALDPLSPAKSDTSEKSLGTPEGIEATLFGTKLERQETVKENKEGPRRAGFWSGRKVVTEEPLSPVSPSDINRQYKSATEMPFPKFDMDEDIAENQRYQNDDIQMRMRQVAPSGQRQPPVGQEDNTIPPSTVTTASVHETSIDDVLTNKARNTTSQTQRHGAQNQPVSTLNSSGAVHETNIDDVMNTTSKTQRQGAQNQPLSTLTSSSAGHETNIEDVQNTTSQTQKHGAENQQVSIPNSSSAFHETNIDDIMVSSQYNARQKPAIPKKPKDLLKQSSNTPSPVSRSPLNVVHPGQSRKANAAMQGTAMYQDLPIKEIPIKDLGGATQGASQATVTTSHTTVTTSTSKWGQSREVTRSNSSDDDKVLQPTDEAQAVSQLWKENDQHEAEMQRILASMTEGDTSETSKYATIGGAQVPSLDNKKQHMKMTLEGHTVYDNDVEMELQQTTKGSWGKHIPGKTIGATSVVRPQPVYASAARKPSLEAEPTEDVKHGDNYIPISGAGVVKRPAEDNQEPEETTTNFQRQVSMRLKKKKKKQQPEGEYPSFLLHISINHSHFQGAKYIGRV